MSASAYSKADAAKRSRVRRKKPACYHCGEPSPGGIRSGDREFCCNGCKLVYELLSEKDLCTYYSLTQTPGNTPEESGIQKKYAYLDDQNVQRQMLQYAGENTAVVMFRIPAMHCSSCIWLLENLYKVEEGIHNARVNFPQKELSITFDHSITSLRAIVELLASLAYEPEINLANLEERVQKEGNKDLYIKIGVAGFAFGNIMLLSFPEYLNAGKPLAAEFSRFFGYLNILLALPVLIYSSSDYFKSALSGFRQKIINIDVPISLGILVLFFRSVYEIVSASGAGFMDSFAGLVFLLLIGKLFQKKTYDALSFERDYRSYFPVSVLRRTKSGDESTTLDNLRINDRILIRNRELVPADSVLIRGRALVDYSFVTGESRPVSRVSGEMLYAGGRHLGGVIEIEVIREVSNSYLTGLWNNEVFSSAKEHHLSSLVNRISRYFTPIVLTIAFFSAFYWLLVDAALAMNAFTSVLIIACPCALALSTPFTLGNAQRIFGRKQFYLKNSDIIENLARTDTIVFDKTGTLTHASATRINFVPGKNTNSLKPAEEKRIVSLAGNSAHPLSQLLYNHLNSGTVEEVKDFEEYPGKGICGKVSGVKLKIGSAKFTACEDTIYRTPATRVHITIDGRYRGHFAISQAYRPALKRIVSALRRDHRVYLLTGDGDIEKKKLSTIFGGARNLLFNQTPYDKLKFVETLQKQNAKVLMIGDGLNDAGALARSDMGISVSEDVDYFSPACDAILDARKFRLLPAFMRFSRLSIKVIIISFIISFLYNLAGLYFAVQGILSPLFAAVLMPLSSISVIVFSTGITRLIAKRLNWNKNQ